MIKKNYSVILYFCMVIGSYVANAQNVNVQLIGQLSYGSMNLSNLWGYTDDAGNEYALVGAGDGLSIVSLKNPAAPVEITRVPGPKSSWREVRTWGKYAYVTTEAAGGALLIVDLSKLPDKNVKYVTWKPTIKGTVLSTIHALHAADGKVYLYGSNIGKKGALILDVTTDPMNPTFLGAYDGYYVHDGEVRNNILYAGHILDGFMSVIDVSNPANPVLKVTKETPLKFTHNTWLTTDNKYVFTTDEKPNSHLTCYDITDINNIKEVDRIQSNPGSNSCVHNTYVRQIDRNDFAISSWYRDGFTIVDAGRPSNLVQVGNYDTYSGSGSGFNGAWGVYAYFPSNTIIVSGIEDGLFVLKPTYIRASYLEGTVTDTVTKKVLSGVKVELLAAKTITETTDVSGKYATGLAQPGTYDVRYTKAGYKTKTVKANLKSGDVALTDVQLVPINFSVGELNAADYFLNAYPSPFNQSLQVDFKFVNKSVVQSKIIITDITGRVVESLALTGSEGSVKLGDNLSKGLYFVRLECNGAYSSSMKVVKSN